MSELLITSHLERLQKGQVFTEDLPLHLTIWQYFTIDGPRVGDFTDELGDVMAGFSPLEIIGAERDDFGQNNDVSVRRVRTLGAGATVCALHAVLGAVIEAYEGRISNPEWAYQNYNPHITYVDGAAIEKGETTTLDQIELVERLQSPKRKIIRQVWALEEI